MRLLTIYGCEPIEIVDGYSQLVIEQPELFWQVQQFLQGSEEIEGVYSLNNKPLKVKNTVAFIGDLASPRDYHSLFGNKIAQRLQHYCSEDSQAELYTLVNQVKNIINQQIYDNELPFMINNEWSLVELFKYCKLTLLAPENASASGIIKYIIDTAMQLGDDRLFVVSDLARYLHDADHIEVINAINELHLNFLELKQSGARPGYLNQAAFHLIDQDLVMF